MTCFTRSFLLLMVVVIGAIQGVLTRSQRSNITTGNLADETVSCDEPFVAVGEQCLLFATFAEVTFQEAHQLCHSLEGEMAAILTATVLEQVINYIHDNGLHEKFFWIDGSDKASEGDWRTSSGLPVPRGTPFWATGLTWSQPDDAFNSAEDCLNMPPTYKYYWNDVRCDLKSSPICKKQSLHFANGSTEDKSLKSCPPLFVNVGGLCLAFMTWAEQPWAEARQSCHGLSAELATITDIEELRAVYLYIHQEGIDHRSFWLGGSDSNKEGSWLWSSDGSSVPSGSPFWGMTHDNIQEPDGGSSENCLALKSEGGHYFRDAACNLHLTPLCLHP